MDLFEFLSIPENQNWVFWTIVLGAIVIGASFSSVRVSKELTK